MVNSSGCIICKRPGTKQCSQCHAVVYCSKDCQKQDWKRHKTECMVFKLKLESKRHHFSWSHKWELSMPGFSDDGESVSCFGRNSLVTSERPFDDDHVFCGLKIYTYSKNMKVGVCTKNKNGQVLDQWMVSSGGKRYGPRGFESDFGKGFGVGSIVVLTFKHSALSFNVNEEDFGVAFTGVSKSEEPVYVCAFIDNAFNLDLENEGVQTLSEQRPSAVQLLWPLG